MVYKYSKLSCIRATFYEKVYFIYEIYLLILYKSFTFTFNASAINTNVLIFGSLSCLSILLKCPLLIPDNCASVSSVILFQVLPALIIFLLS
nr:MAG TPA: hypothetical protein [Caudoviricetes sp.]